MRVGLALSVTSLQNKIVCRAEGSTGEFDRDGKLAVAEAAAVVGIDDAGQEPLPPSSSNRVRASPHPDLGIQRQERRMHITIMSSKF